MRHEVSTLDWPGYVGVGQAYDRMEYVLDERGVPVSRWDGVSIKPSPVTGAPVPDESRRVPLERYVNPRKAAWPQADFVVGNPPFIGNKRMRTALGDGYVEALRGAWSDVPDTADFVMYWWQHAAMLTRDGALQRFGFITTNSIRQTFNRRVIEAALLPSPLGRRALDEGATRAKSSATPESSSGAARHLLSPGERSGQPLSLVFAIPDHPWVDATDGAAVRIAMTVGQAGSHAGRLLHVEQELESVDSEVKITLREQQGTLHPDLNVGSDRSGVITLSANRGISFMGMIPLGEGFWVDHEQAVRLGLGHTAGLAKHVRRYINGKDLTQKNRGILALDFYGMTEAELRSRFPAAYQWLYERVKPTRDHDKRESRRRNWWLFAESVPKFRKAVSGLNRYIGTTETSKHRTFVFVEGDVLPDQKVRVIVHDDAYVLGALSSTIHVTWALAAGGTLEDRPVYNNSRCFEPFPFPVSDQAQKANIRDLAEQLDAHRKRQQAAHTDLTLTGIYNVLDKLRSGEPLTAKERVIHEHGLVSVLRQLHDEIDAAVLDAYGWGDLLPLLRLAHGNDVPAEGTSRDEAKRAFDAAILERLVALNAERAGEEARGQVRWLRPDFQNPSAQVAPEQHDLEAALDDDIVSAASVSGSKPQPWPKDTVAQVRAVADTLATSNAPLSVDDIAARFTARGPWKKRLPQLLDMLVALGRAQVSEGRFSSF